MADAENPSGAGAPELSRPELQFNVVAESADSVISPEAVNDRRKILLRAAGQATVILRQGDTQIGLFDAAGGVVEEAERSGKQVNIADWKKVWDENDLDRADNYRIVKDETEITGDAFDLITLAQVSPDLRPTASALIDSLGPAVSPRAIALPRDSWGLDTSDVSNIAVDVVEDHVVLYQTGNNNLIAFQTENTGGGELPARNWKRVDSLTAPTLTTSVEITERANYLAQPGIQSIQVVGNGATVVVSETGLEVKDEDRPERPASFTENLTNINNNVAVEGAATGVIYYCSEEMQSIYKLKTGGSSLTSQEMPIPGGKEFHGVRNLRLDPSDSFITFSSNEGFFILDKDTLEQIHHIEDVAQGMMDDQGRIHGLNPEGKVVIYEGNFAAFMNAIADEKAAAAMKEATKSAAEKEQDRKDKLEQDLAHLRNRRDTAKAQLRSVIAGLTDVGEVATQGEATITGLLHAAGVAGNADQEEYFRIELEAALRTRQGEIVQPVIDHHLLDLRDILGGDLDYDKYKQAESIRKEAHSIIGFADQSTREEFTRLEAALSSHEESFVGQESQRIQQEVVQLTIEARETVESFDNAIALSAWMSGTNDDGESDYTIVKAQLARLKKECDKLPNKDDLLARLLEAEQELQELTNQKRKELRKKKKTGAEKNKDTERALFVNRIVAFVGTFRDEDYDTRAQADNFLGSGEYASLENEINALADVDPKEARKMRRLLKSSVALVMAEIDRKNTAPEGMVRIGKVLFPIREEVEEEEAPRREITLTMTDTQTALGPNGRPVSSGDLAINIRDDNGTTIRRVYQDDADEQSWRLGLVPYGAESVRSTVITPEDFRQIQKEYTDWKRGDASTIRRELQERKDKLDDYLLNTWTPDPDNPDEEPPAEYTRLNEDYNNYAIEHNYLLFSHLDALRGASEGKGREDFNGFGYIPEWQPYWTLDQQTQKYLEEVAEFGLLQMEDREGICVLQGHAGTGKDVLLDMLAALTRRPKFDFNASKWDEEGTVTEEVILKVEDGQSQTITVPSSIVKGVMTPGALININEINSWPAPTRLFLNSLFDAKRSLNLKTSGKRIVAAKDTLFFGSENIGPGYEGTNDVNIASISRQTEVETDYPPLRIDGRLNPAEAWRTARSVASLEDLTYEMDPAKNEFVRIWDRHINGVNNGAPNITQEQKFDLQVIKNLVEYADKLRKAFVAFQDSANMDVNALPVTQPLTGREFRRSAYFLSNMPETDKIVAAASPQKTAKELLGRLFVRHIRDLTDRQKVLAALNTW